MGRPLNKKFFETGAGFQVGGTGRIGGGNELCYIVSQRSNSTYEIASEAGPATRTGSAKLVDGAPTGENEIQVTVTPENAVTPAEAQFTVNRTAGGVIDDAATVIVNGGYGYWTGGTFNIGVDTDGGYTPGNEAVVTYTVANGSIVTASVTTPGAGFTASADAALAVDTADIPDEDANPPVQSARIISAHTVKTFEGNTFAWPTTGALGQNDRGLGEADLQATTL